MAISMLLQQILLPTSQALLWDPKNFREKPPEVLERASICRSKAKTFVVQTPLMDIWTKDFISLKGRPVSDKQNKTYALKMIDTPKSGSFFKVLYQQDMILEINGVAVSEMARDQGARPPYKGESEPPCFKIERKQKVLYLLVKPVSI